MSTGGKVLVVLVTLLTIVWFGLMSMVARLNSNYGNAVIAGDKSLEDLRTKLKNSTEELRKAENDVEDTHLVTDNDRTILRLEYNDQVKALAETQESLLRLEGLLDTLEIGRVDTENNIATRKKEVTLDQTKLAATIAEVEKEKKNNSDLLAQLTSLRQKFQQMSVANRALASDVAKSKVIQDVSPGSPLVTGR
jgi:hypothetical protein